MVYSPTMEWWATSQQDREHQIKNRDQGPSVEETQSQVREQLHLLLLPETCRSPRGPPGLPAYPPVLHDDRLKMTRFVTRS
jgi:hypothetical protein